MKSTGKCGRVGAFGQTWVATITSPGRLSPWVCMRASLSAAATAVIAPSASETSPIRLGLAPMPPSRPITPSVGALPLARRPSRPGMKIRTKSVEPLAPAILVTVTSTAGVGANISTTVRPHAWPLSNASNTWMVCARLMVRPSSLAAKSLRGSLADANAQT